MVTNPENNTIEISSENSPETPKPESGVLEKGRKNLWPIVSRCDLFDALDIDRARSGSPAGEGRSDFLGKALWVCFVLIVLSGIGLLAGYRPIVSGAFRSVEFIRASFPFGWWLRGVHKYATDLFVIFAILRVCRIVFSRAYIGSGKLTWISSLGLLAFGIVSAMTGYILVWGGKISDAGNAGSAIFENTNPPLGLFGQGGYFTRLISGENGIEQNTLSTIFAWHIGLSLAVLIIVVCWRLMPRRLSPQKYHFNPFANPRVVWTIVGILTLLSLFLPPPLGTPSDRILTPHPILSDWFLLGFYRFAFLVSPGNAITAFAFLALVAVMLPWADAGPFGHRRPSVSALAFAVIVSWILLTIDSVTGGISGRIIFPILVVIWIFALILGVRGDISCLRKSRKRGKSEVTGT